MKFKSLFIIVLFISACGTKNVSEEGSASDSTAANVDSTKIKMSSKIVLVSKFKVVDTFPIVIDSTFITGVDQNDSLSASQVKLLSVKWFEHEISLQYSYEIKTFYEIDSIKNSGGYAKYVESLDVGTESSNVFAVANVKVDEKTNILIWHQRICYNYLRRKFF